MLIDQHNADVLALCRKALEGSFDRRRLRLAVDDQEVLLRVRGAGDVLRDTPMVNYLSIPSRLV